MRLSTQEVNTIIDVLDKFIDLFPCELRLFGSRVDDNKRGGDIDLLLIVPKDLHNVLLAQKHVLLSKIKEKIGDQKIDLKITTPDEIPTDAFLEKIFAESLVLKNWIK